MKKDQIFVAAILAFLMTLMVTSAQANGWTDKGNVYREGVSIGSIYDVMMEKEGMTSEQATSDIKQFYAEQAIQRKKERDQEERARKRALLNLPTQAEIEAIIKAYEKLQKEAGEALALLPENVTPAVQDALKGFFAEHTDTFKAEWGPVLENIRTIDDVKTFYNSAYGTNLSNTDIQSLIDYGSTLSPEAEANYIAGAATCAIKKLSGKGPCGPGTGTGA